MTDIFQTENEHTDKLAPDVDNILQIDEQGRLHVSASLVSQAVHDEFTVAKLSESQKKGIQEVVKPLIPNNLTQLSDFPHSFDGFKDHVIVVSSDEKTLVFKSVQQLLESLQLFPIVKVNGAVQAYSENKELNIQTVSKNPINALSVDSEGGAFLDLADDKVLSLILKNLDFSKLTELQKADLKKAMDGK